MAAHLRAPSGIGSTSPTGIKALLSAFPGLGWVLSSLGISGVLIFFGYINHIAHEDFLGVSLSEERDTVSYILSGGRFFYELALRASTWIALALGLVLFSTVALQRMDRERFSHLSPSIPRGWWAVVLILACLLEIAVYDVPVTKVEGLLLEAASPGKELDFPEPFARWAEEARREIICSRIESDWLKPDDKGQHINVSVCLPVGAEEDEESVEKAQQNYGKNLQSRFTRNVFLTSLALFATIQFLGQSKARAISNRLTSVLVALMTLNLSALPYSYAKTVQPNDYPDVEIYYNPVVERRPEGDHIEQTEGDGTEDKGPSFKGVLLSEGKESIIFWEKTSHMLWELPRSRINLVQIKGRSDLIQQHVKVSLAKKGEDGLSIPF